MNDYNWWSEMFNEFASLYPNEAEKVIDWYPSGRFLITVRLSDGSRLKYNMFEKSIRYYVRADEDEREYMNEDEWRKEFGTRLRDLLKLKGITNAALARIINTHPNMITKYIRGESLPNTYMMALIARTLNCSVSDLIEFDDYV